MKFIDHQRTSDSVRQTPVLAYDIVAHVLELLPNNYALLSQCATVNWEFNHAASRMLYSRVVLSLPFNNGGPDLSGTSSILTTSNFTSATLPQYAPYVTEFVVSGYLSPRPPPRNKLQAQIARALSVFVNLVNLQFIPFSFHEDLFPNIVPKVICLQSLNVLALNGSANDHRCSYLVKLDRIKNLTIWDPGRALLAFLPDWLCILSENLVELHFKGNCGSITPGVLRSFLPHVQSTLHAFSLGLSYSLDNNDVFTFVGNLPKLKTLHLSYYWQIKQPQHQPKLRALTSFTTTSSGSYATDTKRDVDAFSKWIRKAITGSPNLRELRLKIDLKCPSGISYDGLVDHIVLKHSSSIQFLDFQAIFIRADKFEAILTSCFLLEELSVRTSQSSLTVFYNHLSALKHLRSASFQICNVSASYRVDEEFVFKIMRRRPPAFRLLTVDKSSWEASWIINENELTDSNLVVRKVCNLNPPRFKESSDGSNASS